MGQARIDQQVLWDSLQLLGVTRRGNHRVFSDGAGHIWVEVPPDEAEIYASWQGSDVWLELWGTPAQVIAGDWPLDRPQREALDELLRELDS